MLSSLRNPLAAALLAAGAGCAFAQAPAADAPSVTPYRPSVSTPAALSAPGWLEVEAGLMRERGDGGARRASLPYTLKLAFSDDWGIRVGGDAVVTQRDMAGQRLRGVGDTGIVLKRRFAVDDDSAFGIEGGATVPTARTGIGSGKADYTVNGIYSADFGAWHTDLNLAATRIGAVGAGESRRQLLWAASLSRALDERWGAVVELAGTRQRGVDRTAQLLGAISYNVSRSLTLDAGAARSIRSGSNDWSVFTGFTMLAGQLF